MKITFLAPHLKISGGVRVILTYADLLAKRGNEVLVAVQSRNWLRRNIANVFNFKPKWFRDFAAKILRVKNYDEFNMLRSDVVVASNWKDSFWAAKYSQNLGKKFYLVQHDERLYHAERQKADEAFRLPLKKITVASWLKEIFEKEYDQKAEFLINTVDRKLFYPVSVKKIKGEIRILLLHHDYEWKGTREGVEIVRRLKVKYPQVKLILFGARKEKIDFSCDEYHYNLAQKKLAWLYSSCDIFLCPSWDEGFGLPSLEAMAGKCALVTYDNGGSRDFAFDGQTALVAPRRDKETLYQKLELAVRDKNLREIIAKDGYNFVQKMPTWEEQAEKLEGIFKEA